MGLNQKVIDWRRRTKQRALIYKGGTCIVCGYLRSVRALHFHHLDPSRKEFRVGSGNTRAWATIKRELDKCVVLCGNCHSEAHDGILDLTPHLHKNPSPEDGERRILASSFVPRQGRARVKREPYPQGQKTCARCGASIGRRSTHCRPCHKKAVPPPTKVAWPPPEDLLREVEATSKRAVGLRLGVSDAAVKKRLVRYLPGYQPRPYRRAA